MLYEVITIAFVNGLTTGVHSVNIYNTTGSKILTTNVNAVTGSVVSLNVSSLESGLYVAVFESDMFKPYTVIIQILV